MTRATPHRALSFTVAAGKKKVKLDSSGAAQAPFTVTNTSTQTLRASLLTRAAAPASPDWFSIVGDAIREFPPNAPQPVVVQLTVPPGSAPGSYSFRLDAVSQALPDEDFTQSPAVAFEVEPPDHKKPFPWGIVIVVGGVAVVILGAILVILLN